MILHLQSFLAAQGGGRDVEGACSGRAGRKAAGRPGGGVHRGGSRAKAQPCLWLSWWGVLSPAPPCPAPLPFPSPPNSLGVLEAWDGGGQPLGSLNRQAPPPGPEQQELWEAQQEGPPPQEKWGGRRTPGPGQLVTLPAPHAQAPEEGRTWEPPLPPERCAPSDQDIVLWDWCWGGEGRAGD